MNDVDAAVWIVDGGETARPIPREIEFSLRSMDLGSVTELMKGRFRLVMVGGPVGFRDMGIEHEWQRAHGQDLAPTDQGKGLGRYLESARSYEVVTGELQWNVDRMPPVMDRFPPRVWNMDRTVLAVSRHGQPVAAVYRTVSYGSDERMAPRLDTERHGLLYFLPPSRLPALDAAMIILEDLFGLVSESAPPGWVEEAVAPGQADVDRKIEDAERQLEELKARKLTLEAERKQLREPLRLLYESKRALEPVVLDILEKLGAKVERPPKDVNAEDGWITATVGGEELHGVLEIKTTEKAHLPELPIRQAVDWREKSITERGHDYKGIVIGAADVEAPPSERGDPFSHNFKKNAERNRIAVLRCEDLYHAYQLHSDGRLDSEAFFRRIFETEGIAVFDDLFEGLP